MKNLEFLTADFAPGLGVRGMTYTRKGGVSEGPYGSLNLATHVDDDPAHVEENRRRLGSAIDADAPPLWLDQCHGTDVFLLEENSEVSQPPRADAAVCRLRGRVLAVLTADCLPVLLASEDERVVGIAHAGWRGLCAGVLENTVAAMGAKVSGIHAWLGPAIGPVHFEVGPEVREAFVTQDAGARSCFLPHAGEKWLADLAGLARSRLEHLGMTHIEQANRCTFSEPGYFYSYRRDGECGRMASLVWLAPD